MMVTAIATIGMLLRVHATMAIASRHRFRLLANTSTRADIAAFERISATFTVRRLDGGNPAE